jgi:dipeptidyl aminopeptidase/acylaminoacyl peptidase
MVLVRAEPQPANRLSDVSPARASLRSQVHEYGGGAYCLVPSTAGRVEGDEMVALAYVDQDDQRVWFAGMAAQDWEAVGEPRPLSTEPPAATHWRHGDLRATPDGRFILAVREEHEGGRVSRSVVAYAVVGEDGTPTAPGPGATLLEGRDFYAAARPDPGGRRLAWICWDHPDMPWDGSELWVGETDLLGPVPVDRAVMVAGGTTSVGQPLWCTDGSLVFAWDAAGWWQPYRWRDGDAQPVRLCDEEAECHGPDWSLGQATMAELPGGAIALRLRRDGADSVAVLRPGSTTADRLDQPCVSVSGICSLGGGAAWLGATPEISAAAWWWPGPVGESSQAPRPWLPPEPPLLAAADVSVARHFSFEGRSGWTVHGLYFPPTLAGTSGPAGVAPPLVVTCHGGPTGSAEAGFDPVVQLLTTRGYAVAAVDYAGSTGYGRAYRERLWGRWGEADVDDCVDAALFLAAHGQADGARMAIRGSSAGGLTALGALVRSDAFAAAVSWYGVTDLLALVAATHDFESRYTDRLVGPLPEAEDEYRQRSPVNRVADITGSVLVLQGLDDPVVPPSQAESMVAALRARGLECRYLAFPGESHGFRRADTLEACLEAELEFYGDCLADS